MSDFASEATKPIDAARDALTVRRVFGDPIEAGGATVIPVAHVIGGAGTGFGSGAGSDPRSGEGPNAEGSGGGGGFGLCARPAGVFVVRDGEVTWKPALDLNLAILGGQVLGGVIAVAAACAARARSRAKAAARRG